MCRRRPRRAINVYYLKEKLTDSQLEEFSSIVVHPELYRSLISPTGTGKKSIVVTFGIGTFGEYIPVSNH